MRAFIFSLDAFVAFTLALIAIYSLIFFSSIPSSYYYLITQGHYLTRDVLMALSTTTCNEAYYTCTNADFSLLDNIVSQKSDPVRKQMIAQTVGAMIPSQFGYTMEISDNRGQTWDAIYDSTVDAPQTTAKKGRKMSVTAQVLSFGYSTTAQKPNESVYNYLSCNGGLGIITCGEADSGAGAAAGDVTPAIDAKIVRLTVFI